LRKKQAISRIPVIAAMARLLQRTIDTSAVSVPVIRRGIVVEGKDNQRSEVRDA